MSWHILSVTDMKRMLFLKFVLCVFVLGVFSCEQDSSTEDKVASVENHHLEVQLDEILTLRKGQTRADVSKLFEPQGGLALFFDTHTFWYKKNNLIKIDIKFDMIDKKNAIWNSEDKIIEISKPYLQKGVYFD